MAPPPAGSPSSHPRMFPWCPWLILLCAWAVTACEAYRFRHSANPKRPTRHPSSYVGAYSSELVR